MQLKEAQQRAVEHRGSSALVSASAGSGKTEVLARRCLAYLADPRQPGDVGRLLVVTFTRAAAAELRVRIARMLREHARAADPPMRRHLLRQVARIDAADIGTIDAWCQRVLRTHFAEAGVDPGFAILGEDEAGLLRHHILARTINWVYESDAPAAEQARAWIAARARPGDAFLRQTVLELNRFRERLLDPADWFAAQQSHWHGADDEIARHATGQIAAAVEAECQFQLSALPAVLAIPEAAPVQATLETYRDWLTAWAAALRDPARLTDVLTDIDARRLSAVKGKPAAAKVLADEIRKGWFDKRLKSPWRPLKVARALEHPGVIAARMRALLGVEAEYERLLGEAKQRRGVFEFGDVLRRTCRLLHAADGEPDGLTATLRARYDQLLIDEYQDTSPIQVAMFDLLGRAEPGNRFLVGDLKQSIYGFRDADPTLFIRQEDDFDSGRVPGQVLPLQDNFRSASQLVAAFNELFAGLFHRELGGTNFDDRQRLVAARDERPNEVLDNGARFRVSVLPEPGRGETLPLDADGVPHEQIEIEGFEIARRIRDLLDAGACKVVRGPDRQPRLEPIGYGDIVILVRAVRGNGPQLARILRQAGIPVMVAGRESILDSAEVTDLRTILRLVGNRRLDLEMAAYLRGPAVGLTERDLLAIRRGAAPKVPFAAAALRYARSSENPDLARTVAEALEQLTRWRRAARVLELPDLLRKILRESGLELFARGLPAGEHRVAVLEALFAIAERFTGPDGGSAAAFVQHLDALQEDRLDPEVNIATREDVVRIMTIHMSKGLEFPVVFLATAGVPFSHRFRSGPVLCDPHAGIGLAGFDADLRCEFAGAAHLVAQQRRQQVELGEELRLLYVAATRAREVFHVVGFAKADDWDDYRVRCTPGTPLPLLTRLTATSVLHWTLAGIATAPGREALFDVAVCNPIEVVKDCHDPAEPPPPLPQPTAADREWVAQARDLLAREPDLRAARRPAAVSVSALKAATEPAGDSTAPTFGLLARPRFAGRGTTAQDFGSLVHRFLEHVEFADLATPRQIQDACARLVADARLAPDAPERLPVDDLAWFGDHALVRKLAGESVRVWREQPFAYPLPEDATGERVLVRGVLDCLVETADGLHLLDYKTDRIRDEAAFRERRALYARQIQLYALAVAAALDRPVASGSIVFLRARRIEPVDVADTALRTLLEDLAEK